MKKLSPIAIAIALLLLAVHSCVKDKHEPGNDPPGLQSLTISRARAIFEEYVTSMPSLRSGDSPGTGTISPGNFAPDWQQAQHFEDDRLESVNVPFTAEYVYVGKFARDYTDPADTTDLYYTAIAQKLVVVLDKQTGSTDTYIATIIPGPGKATRNREAVADMYYHSEPNRGFDGMVLFTKPDGEYVYGVYRHRDGAIYDQGSGFEYGTADQLRDQMAYVMGYSLIGQVAPTGARGMNDDQGEAIETIIVWGFGPSIWRFWTPPGSNIPSMPGELPPIDEDWGGHEPVIPPGYVPPNPPLQPAPLDPCNKSAANRANVLQQIGLMKNAQPDIIGTGNFVLFEDFKQVIRNNPGIEHAAYLYNYGRNGYKFGNITTSGNTHSVNISPSESTVAFIHNHPTLSAPSPSDVYALIDYFLTKKPDGSYKYSELTSCYVYAEGSICYVLEKDDEGKAETFFNNYSSQFDQTKTTNHFTLGSTLHEYHNNINVPPGLASHEEEAYRLAATLGHYDAGVKLISVNFDDPAPKATQYEWSASPNGHHSMDECKD